MKLGQQVYKDEGVLECWGVEGRHVLAWILSRKPILIALRLRPGCARYREDGKGIVVIRCNRADEMLITFGKRIFVDGLLDLCAYNDAVVK